jgi:hypothetical protein
LDWQAIAQLPNLGQFTEWAAESRNPCDVPDATSADARAAIETAERVVDAVLTDLQGRGFVWDEPV